MRQMSLQGFQFLREQEGERLFVYDDATGQKLEPGDPIRGTATGGVGHTGSDVVPGMLVTKELSERWLQQDARAAEECVEANCPGANDHQQSALVSVCFNIGTGAFKGSSIVRMWNKGDKMAAGNAISMWTKTTIGGVLQDSPGLIARRARETALFFTPMPNEAPQTMPQVVENPGKVLTPGKVIAATSAAVPPAVVIAENAKPAIDAIQNTAATVQQATTAWSAIKDALGSLANGHVLTVVCLGVALVAFVVVAVIVIRRIRRGEVAV